MKQGTAVSERVTEAGGGGQHCAQEGGQAIAKPIHNLAYGTKKLFSAGKDVTGMHR